MKKLKNIILPILFISIGLLVGCDNGGDITDVDDPGGTSVEEMAGDWFVTFTLNGSDNFSLGYQLLSTYNTAADDGQEIWIDDHSNTWGLKVKSPINLSARTIAGTGLDELYYGAVVDISDGIIIHDAATTTGGNVSDSIYFKVEFSDLAGVWEMAGYKRTGFLEDEH